MWVSYLIKLWKYVFEDNLVVGECFFRSYFRVLCLKLDRNIIEIKLDVL